MRDTELQATHRLSVVHIVALFDANQLPLECTAMARSVMAFLIFMAVPRSADWRATKCSTADAGTIFCACKKHTQESVVWVGP